MSSLLVIEQTASAMANLVRKCGMVFVVLASL